MSRRTRRLIRRARPFLLVVLVASGLLLIAGAVLGVQAWQARADLKQARVSLSAAHQAIKDGDQQSATSHLHAATSEAGRARDRVTDWLWSGYGHLPVAGPVVREARGLIELTDVVTREVLSPLVAAAPTSGAWSGQADVAGLRAMSQPLTAADSRLSAVRAEVAALPESRVSVLDQARSDFARAVDSLAVDLRDVAVATKILPSMLGADRPAHLLLVTQNLAEERATGGLLGAFALLEVDRGRITLLRSGSDSELVDASAPVTQLGSDFDARYGVAEATSTWRSANLTPNVPSAGAILAGLSASQLDQRVDGVALVDPVALSYLLKATGPVDVPGLGAMSSDNAVPLLLKDVYRRYAGLGEQEERKEALRVAIVKMVERLQQPTSGGLARELARAASTGHLQLFATDREVEKELLRSRIAGALPSRGPYLSVVTQDVGGSKLGYYLKRAVSYTSKPSPVAVSLGAGPETVEEATVTVRLRNDAPAKGLPPYVTYRADDPRARPRAQLKSWVSVYLGPRSSYSSATVNGRPVALSSEVERGLTVLSTYVTIDPGQTVTLVLKVQQPAAPGSVLLWRQQPRLAPDDLQVRRAGSPQSFARVYEP